MPSYLKAKLKQFPSGMSSFVVSSVVVGSPLVSRAELKHSSLELAAIVLFAKAFQDGLASCFKAGYGRLGNKTKLSWKSCRNLRERMAAIERIYGRDNCGFLTVTLPSISSDAFEALARFSSYAMNRLNLAFNRYFKNQNLARVAVWEYQKRGALHCHLLLASDCMDAINCEEFRLKVCEIWHRILTDIGEQTDCNMFSKSSKGSWKLPELKSLKDGDNGIFVDFQKVQKSVVAYLSKYLSDSNHEHKDKSKQFLRNKFYPIATWSQWNRKATECYEQLYEEIDLVQCEPDKRSLLEKLLEKLHFDLLTKIPLARNTEIIKPKNPYNIGFYFLPANPESNNLATLLASFIEKISIHFRPELRLDSSHQKLGNAHIDNAYIDNAHIDNAETISVFMMLRKLELEKRINKRKYAKEFGLNIANLGMLFVDFYHSIDYINSCKTYLQLSLL